MSCSYHQMESKFHVEYRSLIGKLLSPQIPQTKEKMKMKFEPGDLVCFKDQWGSSTEVEHRVHPLPQDRDKSHYCVYDHSKSRWIPVPAKEGVDPLVGRHTFDYFLVVEIHTAKNKFQANYARLLFPDGCEILANVEDLDEERTIHANSQKELVQETG